MVLDLDLTGQGTSISRGVLRKGFNAREKGIEEGMEGMCVSVFLSLLVVITSTLFNEQSLTLFYPALSTPMGHHLCSQPKCRQSGHKT